MTKVGSFITFYEPVYRHLAGLVGAYHRCVQNENHEWRIKHREAIEEIIDNHLPSGSGWDCGTSMDLDNSTEDKLIFFGSYHHMDEDGMYCGWSEYTITVTPSLFYRINIEVEGEGDVDEDFECEEELTKDDLHSRFDCSLKEEVTWQTSFSPSSPPLTPSVN